MREIVFYRTASGQCPIEQFLDSLEPKHAQKVTWVLKLVEELDSIPKQYFKKLIGSDDIWEVRVQAGNNIYRLLGFLEDKNIVILNHAFQKKSQKTPIKEIRMAEKRKHNYIQRNNKNE